MEYTVGIEPKGRRPTGLCHPLDEAAVHRTRYCNYCTVQNQKADGQLDYAIRQMRPQYTAPDTTTTVLCRSGQKHISVITECDGRYYSDVYKMEYTVGIEPKG
ncbi:hypothetical protein J6590_027519 [Homalodisca vitripennis]|nr:hypothetical protein J6590_027519 [Homalodisca vitripennis]